MAKVYKKKNHNFFFLLLVPNIYRIETSTIYFFHFNLLIYDLFTVGTQIVLDFKL